MNQTLTTFREMDLSDPILKATLEMGFEETTPIQAKTIPLVLQGSDIIGQAQTGTGKTAAFGIPIIEKISRETNNKIKGLVVTPTRELAVQVAEEINRLAQLKKGARALPIYGGQNIARQIKSLRKNPPIIVGTPGRLLDHMRRETINLEGIEIVTLDEADEMLNMGFIDDIKEILQKTPSSRQTLMFSATMPEPIKKLGKQFMKEAELVRTKSKEVTLPGTEQHYVEVSEKDKFNVFCRLLDSEFPEKAIVFCRTKKRVDELYKALMERGYYAEGIHGDMTQARRDDVINNFRSGFTELLVATDVASRGLDVYGISHIYNFDIPQDADSYVHRIGRTGRAGETGVAITLVTPREKRHLKLIEKSIKRKIPAKTAPTLDEAIEGKQKLAVEKLMDAANQKNVYQHYKLARELVEENDSVELVAGALNLLIKDKDDNKKSVKLTEEGQTKKKPKKKTAHKSSGATRGKTSKGQNKKENKKVSSQKKDKV